MPISRRYFLKTSGLSLFGAGLTVPTFLRRTAFGLEQPHARKKILVAIFSAAPRMGSTLWFPMVSRTTTPCGLRLAFPDRIR